jgi:hypothetical protein
MGKTFIFGLMLSSFATATAAQNANCDAVLNFTGRESSILSTSDIGKKYSQYSDQNSTSTSASYSKGLVKAAYGSNSASNTSRTNLEEWEKRYFQSLDRVFAPAVQAWSACMSGGDSIDFRPQLNTGDALVIDMTPRAGITVRVQGVEVSPGFECKVNNQVVNAATSLVLPHANWAVICRRKNPRSLGGGEVVVKTSVKSFTVPIPAKERPLADYDTSRRRTLAEFKGCSSLAVIDAEPYARKVALEAVMRGSGKGKNMQLDVLVNGQPQIEDRGNVGNNNEAGLGPSRRTLTLPAYVPAVVKMSGAVADGGSCKSLTGAVYDSLPR